MSKTIQVRGLTIGAGMPKICAPLVGRDLPELTRRAQALLAAKPDLAEWRVDYLERIGDAVSLLPQIRALLGELPLLFTFRTKKEGGEQELSTDAYRALLRDAASSGQIDLLDVELSAGDEPCRELIDLSHANRVAVVLSSHDFQKTPPAAELLERLRIMRRLGADLPKIAVTPNSSGDVLALLSATGEMSRTADCPVITMSMGGVGAISRVCGECFGSAVTFGSAGKASAPGQLEVGELRVMLEILHRSLQ